AVNDYADYIVVNGYYGWFYFPSINSEGKEFVAHPEFTFLNGVSDEDSKDMLALPHSDKKAEYFFDSIAKNSLIYANRQLIQQELVGNTPEEKPRELLREMQCVFFKRCNLARYTAFTEKSEATQRAILEAPEYRLAPVTDSNNIPIKYWKKIASEAKGKVFFYMNPMNPALGTLSATNHSENIQVLETELTSENVVFKDFTFNHNIPSSDFTDATHTLKEGNEKIADLIYELVQK
ncbi:hypothetical protein HUU53_04925, partial [Candidatus Micrarchaeota archaeon]|nr:hypothetical protein [Candidatus Micrarchaeota archaeon]